MFSSSKKYNSMPVKCISINVFIFVLACVGATTTSMAKTIENKAASLVSAIEKKDSISAVAALSEFGETIIAMYKKTKLLYQKRNTLLIALTVHYL